MSHGEEEARRLQRPVRKHLALVGGRTPDTMNPSTMRKKLIIVGAICVLLAAAFFGGVTIFILKARKATASTGPFANIAESDIPGRYKYISGDKENFMTLYEDHSFMNKDGLINTKHRWDLTPEGLVIHWLANDTTFDRIEAPGIYTGPKEDGTRRRMEKQPADPSDLIKPAQPVLALNAPPLARPMAKPAGDVVASIRFGADGETNQLTPVNTGGDGMIFPGNIGGAECAQLIRKPGRPEGFLYLRIAPELKEPPFTNAMIVVEYFDTAPANVRASLSIQYDSPIAPYYRAPQRTPLTGTETWKEAWFVLDAPAFQSRQNARGDFRLTTANPDLFVRSVKLLKNLRPPAN